MGWRVYGTEQGNGIYGDLREEQREPEKMSKNWLMQDLVHQGEDVKFILRAKEGIWSALGEDVT